MIKSRHCAIAALCSSGLLASASPASAQQGETRVGARLLYVNTSAETAPVGDTGSSMVFDSAWTVELDTTWMLGQNLGLEWMITASRHSIDSRGGSLDGLDLGNLWIAESTLTLKYQVPMWGKWSPYAGLGVGGAYIFSSSVSDAAKAVGVHRVRSDLLSGAVVQVGVNYRHGRHWILSADIKYAGLSGDVRLKGEANATTFWLDTDLDPWLVGIGAALRF
jgi:outer membrane protein W